MGCVGFKSFDALAQRGAGSVNRMLPKAAESRTTMNDWIESSNGLFYGESVEKISVGDTVELCLMSDDDGLHVEVLELLETRVRVKMPLGSSRYWRQSHYSYDQVRKV
mgnify:CR=1 FL=1